MARRRRLSKQEQKELSEKVEKYWWRTQTKKAYHMFKEKVHPKIIATVTELPEQELNKIEKESGVDMSVPPERLKSEDINLPPKKCEVTLDGFLKQHQEQGMDDSEIKKRKIAFGMLRDRIPSKMTATVSGVSEAEVEKIEDLFEVELEPKTKPLVK